MFYVHTLKSITEVNLIIGMKYLNINTQKLRLNITLMMCSIINVAR